MKAIVFRKLGSPDVLTYEEIEKPVPGPEQVLIRVHAAATNPLDWRLLSGITFVIRKVAELFIKRGVPGRDVAGVVEAVGVTNGRKSVSRFAPGDEVFGTCRGAFAEYACGAEKDLVHKPAGVSFEQAAAVPIAALTALQGLRDQGSLKPGHRVLINGAAGGVGTFGVQIAKALGAVHVAGVCSTRNVEMVRKIGADHVFDYTRQDVDQDFTQTSERYDVILDNMGNHPFSAFRRLLTPDGRYVGAGGPKEFSKILAGSFAALWLTMVDKRHKMVLAKASVADLTLIGEWMAAGKVKSVIDWRYPLAETADALRYLEKGHARGKVVISICHAG